MSEDDDDFGGGAKKEEDDDPAARKFESHINLIVDWSTLPDFTVC